MVSKSEAYIQLGIPRHVHSVLCFSDFAVAPAPGSLAQVDEVGGIECHQQGARSGKPVQADEPEIPLNNQLMSSPGHREPAVTVVYAPWFVKPRDLSCGTPSKFLFSFPAEGVSYGREKLHLVSFSSFGSARKRERKECSLWQTSGAKGGIVLLDCRRR